MSNDMNSNGTTVTRKRQEVGGQLIDAKSGKVIPTPRRRPLKTAHDIRAQMANVYWDVRRGKLDPARGNSLVYMLSQILRAHTTLEVEAHLAALERQVGSG